MATVEKNFSLLNKEQIAAMKAKRLSFNRRKACIRKKTMELSVLCDVNACVFIVDGSEIETWPEKQHDVLKIIKKYKKCHDDVEYNKEDIVVDHQNQNSSSWEDYLIDGLPIESLEEVLRTVDSKLEALDRRIEAGMGAAAEAEQGFLSMQAFLQTPCVQESPNQKQHKSASSEQRFFSSMLPLQMNPSNIQESDQILYYLPHGQYLQPPQLQIDCSKD